MQAEIIAVGSELTTGAKLDTNSQWLSLGLGEIGIPVHFHTTIPDDLQAMIEALRAAVGRSDLVCITGGLGPTLDDLTRQALAGLAGVELVLDERSLEFIRALFARRGREMPERNVIQAMFPAGSRPIRNPRGSAPGIWMELPREKGDGALLCQGEHQEKTEEKSPVPCFTRIIAMPGVPSEMKRMFQHEVLPLLAGGSRVIRRARINCFGVGESAAEEMLGELTARGRDPEVGITVHEATITLRVTAHGESAEECRRKIDEARRSIREKLGDLVFGVEDEELEHVVVRLLAERGLTLATAESGTGGLLAHRLTEVDGFETCYLGGVVVPTDTAKRRLLDADVAVPSAESAATMAAGCRNHFGTDFALAVTECPRFDPDDTNAASPAAYVALAGENLLETAEHTLVGDPAIIKSRAAKQALNLLRLHLMR